MFIIYDGQKLDVTSQDLVQMAETGKINADTDVSFKGAFHKAGEFKELKKIFDARKEVPKPKEDPPFNGVVPPLESKSGETKAVEVPLQKNNEIKSEEAPSIPKSPASTISSNKIILFAVLPLALAVFLLLGILIGRSSQTKEEPTSKNVQEVSVTSAPEKPESKLDNDVATGLDISVKIIKEVLKNPYSAKFHPKYCEKSNLNEKTWLLFEIDVESANDLGGYTSDCWRVFLRKDEKKSEEWDRPWDCPCVSIDRSSKFWMMGEFSQNKNDFYVKGLEGYEKFSSLHNDFDLTNELESGENYEHISLEE